MVALYLFEAHDQGLQSLMLNALSDALAYSQEKTNMRTMPGSMRTLSWLCRARLMCRNEDIASRKRSIVEQCKRELCRVNLGAFGEAANMASMSDQNIQRVIICHRINQYIEYYHSLWKIVQQAIKEEDDVSLRRKGDSYVALVRCEMLLKAEIEKFVDWVACDAALAFVRDGMKVKQHEIKDYMRKLISTNGRVDSVRVLPPSYDDSRRLLSSAPPIDEAAPTSRQTWTPVLLSHQEPIRPAVALATPSATTPPPGPTETCGGISVSRDPRYKMPPSY